MSKTTLAVTFRVTVCVAFLAVSHASPRQAFAASDSCVVLPVEAYSAHKFVLEDIKKSFVGFRKRTLCKFVEDEHNYVTDPELATKRQRLELSNHLLRGFVMFWGYCTAEVISQDFFERLRKNDLSDILIPLYAKACRDFWQTMKTDPFELSAGQDSNPKRMKVVQSWKQTVDAFIPHIKWLQTEVFCETSRYVASAGGLKEALLYDDLPAFENLKKESYSLCERLKKGSIKYDYALYKFNQEMAWVKRQYRSELAKKGIYDLLALLKSLL